MSNLLEVQSLSVAYGDVQVLWDINLEVGRGDFVALVGANGAGKTTTINAISGLLPPMAGEILFNGERINDVPPWERVRMGIAQMPEGRKLFAGLTTEQNLRLGAYLRNDDGVDEDLNWVMDLFPEVERRRDQLAGSLSGGEQQMVSIGRALMAKPKLFLVDELSLGLAPVIVDRLAEILARLHSETELTIFLVEQDVQVALEMVRWGYVIEAGRITTSGPAKELLASDEVRKAYLGV
jgi:branched-chain amino acid transport system ATP-binding protein